MVRVERRVGERKREKVRKSKSRSSKRREV